MDAILKWSFKDWLAAATNIFKYLLSKWYLLLVATVLGCGWGYWSKKDVKPTYTSTISFVLSTENSRGGAGLAGLASQLGLDGGIVGGSENVFSGDNIIELFKSKKMVRRALLSKIDTISNQSLLNFVLLKLYPNIKDNLPFPEQESKFNNRQRRLFKTIVSMVSNSFTVFKRDKKLVFYYISATSTDQEVAYHTAKTMLAQTSAFFIETKTSAALRGLRLLQKESDSLDRALRNTYVASAGMVDRTFNLNPSLTVQRSGAQLNQAKATAMTSAYNEVIRNLEIAKINVQRETPLFGIIDESELPISPTKINIKKKYRADGNFNVLFNGTYFINI